MARQATLDQETELARLLRVCYDEVALPSSLPLSPWRACCASATMRSPPHPPSLPLSLSLPARLPACLCRALSEITVSFCVRVCCLSLQFPRHEESIRCTHRDSDRIVDALPRASVTIPSTPLPENKWCGSA